MGGVSKKPRGDAGFMGIESLGSLTVLLLLLPVLAYLAQWGLTQMQNRAVADHLARVSTAAQAYARKHYDALLAASSPTSGAVVSLDTLRNENFLPVGFRDKNAWGQEYTVYTRQPGTGVLQTLVLTTGGRGHSASEPDFANIVVPSTAAHAGGFAGYIPTGLADGQSSGTLQGVFNGWALDLGTANIPSPGPGHLGALANLTAQDVGQDFLYRNKVPGHAELNAMNTELDMTDHAIDAVKSLRFTPHPLTDMQNFCTTDKDEGRLFMDKDTGLYLCRNRNVESVPDSGNSTLFRQATLAVDGSKIPKPICAPGTNTHPEIFVAPSIAAAGAEAPPMTALQAWSTSVSDTEWQVHLRLLTTDTNAGWITPAPNYGRIMTFTTCAKD